MTSEVKRALVFSVNLGSTAHQSMLCTLDEAGVVASFQTGPEGSILVFSEDESFGRVMEIVGMYPTLCSPALQVESTSERRILLERLRDDWPQVTGVVETGTYLYGLVKDEKVAEALAGLLKHH